jgi:hypothetical protein
MPHGKHKTVSDDSKEAGLEESVEKNKQTRVNDSLTECIENSYINSETY